jgi:subtilisin family serine protease
MNRLYTLLLAMAVCGSASAQLRLPSLHLPPALGPLDSLRRPVQQLADRIDLRELPDLRGLRLDTAGRLLREHPDVVEADPRGEPVLRAQILAWSPSAAGLEAARAAGLRVLREERFEELGQSLVVLGVPAGAATGALLERLRALDPDGHYDFNHVYTGSGAGSGGGASMPDTATQAAASGPAGGAGAGTGARIGLVDSGIDTAHPALRQAAPRTWGCEGVPHPDTHGTAVAALMVGRDKRFRGAMPGAQLFAADIYCASPAGGSAAQIAAALGWLARERVGVINLSLVGPPNQALERMVAAMIARGHLLVAAVGNDGPAAPPLYPASYPGVVGVTAVDRRGQPLPEAARGPQVQFAAPGNQMLSASPGDPAYRPVRGTSFAAPIVAGLLAPALPRPGVQQAREAVAALARQASGGSTTVSNTLGYGIVGADLRVDPKKIFEGME